VYKDDHILTSFVLQTKVNFAAAKTLKRGKPSYYSSPSFITKYLHPVQRKGKLSLSNMETKGIKDQRKDLKRHLLEGIDNSNPIKRTTL